MRVPGQSIKDIKRGLNLSFSENTKDYSIARKKAIDELAIPTGLRKRCSISQSDIYGYSRAMIAEGSQANQKNFYENEAKKAYF